MSILKLVPTPFMRNSLKFKSVKFSSSAIRNNFVLLEVDDETGIAQISLNRPPVNSLNADLIRDLSKAFDELEANKSRGVILTSVREKIKSVLFI